MLSYARAAVGRGIQLVVFAYKDSMFGWFGFRFYVVADFSVFVLLVVWVGFCR